MPETKARQTNVQVTAVTRDDLLQGLQEDLSREYQAIIAYVVYSQALKGAQYMSIAKELELHAAEELQHALAIAKIIDYLGSIRSIWPRRWVKRCRTSRRARALRSSRKDVQPRHHGCEEVKRRQAGEHVVHAGRIQNSAAQARHRLGAEQRTFRSGQQHPRPQDRISLRGQTKALHRRIRQQAVCGLQDDEQQEQYSGPLATRHAL